MADLEEQMSAAKLDLKKVVYCGWLATQPGLASVIQRLGRLGGHFVMLTEVSKHLIGCISGPSCSKPD